MAYTKWQKDKIRKDLCWRCGKNPPKPTRITCVLCLRYTIEQKRLRRQKNRTTVLAHYGTKCQCCGEDKLPFLALDHVGGKIDKLDYKTGTDLVEQVIKLGFPKDFQILCHNCNMAVRWGRICPHKEGVSISVSKEIDLTQNPVSD